MGWDKGIIGHKDVLKLLDNAVRSGRAAHAYLFAGPSGVGKGLIARRLAAALNCVSTEPPCGGCEECISIEAASHPNLFILGPTDKDGEPDEGGLIRVDAVRGLQEALRYRVEAGRKVAVVDGADRLQTAAANAFLKTLEEPPPDTVIILVSSRPSELLPTVLSRCQRINFRPLSPDGIKGLLAESRGLGDKDAALLARLSSGSASLALRYADEGLHEAWAGVAGKLGGLKTGDTLGIMRLATELAEMDDLDGVLEHLKTRVRDSLVRLEGLDDLMVDPQAPMPSAASGATLVESFMLIENARRSVQAPRYANKQLAMETLLFSLAAKGAFPCI